MFAKKGLVVVPKDAADEDKLTEIVLDAGAEDLSDDGDYWEVTTAPKDHEAVAAAVKKAGITAETSEITMLPNVYQKLEGTQANAMMRLLDTLEDLDDTQNVYSNFESDEMPVSA